MKKEWKISPALRISLIYALLGGLWILLSDQVAAILFPEPDLLQTVQTYKGWFFITATALILFSLLVSEKNTLKNAEQNFSDLLEATSEGIFRSSPQGRFIIVNAAMAEIFGYGSPEEMLQQVTAISTQIHLSKESRDKFTGQLGRDGTVERYEARNLRKDGSIIWTSTNARVVRDKSGEVLYYEGFVTDITKQKNAENALIEAEKRYRLLVENLPAVVFMDIFNDPQSTKYMSPRLQDLLGYTPEEWAAGENLWENSLHPDDKERVIAEDIRTDQTGESFRIEYRMRHRDGHYVWVKEDSSILRGEDGTPLFWQGILLNISTQKQAEENLRRRDDILKAIGFSAEQFLKAANWEDCIDLSLERLGKATQVSRVYVFKKYLSPENIVMVTQVSEWSSLGTEPQIDNPELQNKNFAADGFSRWIEFFDQGLPVYGLINDFPVKEKKFLEEQDILSLICIPLQVGRDWWGFIGFDDCDHEHEWSEVEVETLKAAASTLSTAIEKKTAEEDLQKQFKELTVLHAVALAESTVENTDELIQRITNIIGDMLYPDTCGILLLNETRDMLKPHPSYRGTNEENLSLYMPLTIGITGKVAASGQPICTADVSLETAYYETAEGIRSELCVPISDGHTIIGVLNVESRKPKAFATSDERLLTTIASGMAKAIERIKLFEMEQKRRQQAEILREATGELNSLFEAEKLFENIFNSLAKLIGYDSACIEVLKQDSFEIIAGKNIPDKLIGIRYTSDVEKWGDLINSRQPIIIVDVRQDDRFHRFEETSYIRGWMAIPLFVKDKLIGLLDLDSRMPGFFTEEHASIVQTFANQAAIAMENARLFSMERQRRNQAEILSQATSALANTLDIDSLYENILDWMQKIAPYDSASIMLNNGDSEKLIAKRNLPKQYQIGQTFPITKRWRQIANSRQPYILEDAQQSEHFEKWDGSSYIHGWMCIAMYAQDKLIGLINLDSKTTGAFTEEHGILAQTFANQAATAIDNARLFGLEQKRRKDAEIVRQATTILTTLLDLTSLHEAILEWLYKITPYSSASIMEIEGDFVRLTAGRGLPNLEKILGQTFSHDNALCKIMNETYEPLIIEDCEKDTRFERWGNVPTVGGWMGVPLISRGQVIGYITLDSLAPGTFTQNDATAAQIFAHQAATSIENSRLFTETKQRLEELEVVSRVSFALRAAQDTLEMLPILLDEIKASVGTDSAAIWLYEFESNKLVAKAVSGQFNLLTKSNFRPGEGIVGTVYSSGTAHITSSIVSNPATHTENAESFGEGWGSITVPIRTTSETIGTLAVALNNTRKIESHQVRLMTTIAEIAGNAIHRSNLYKRSEEQIHRLTTLRELDTAIASSLDLRITLSILTGHLLQKMGVSAVTILVFNPESQTLEYFAVDGFKNRENVRAPLNIGDGIAGQILLSRRAFYIKDLSGEGTPRHLKPLNHEQFKSYYAIPLFSKGTTRGILETYFRQTFSPSTDWIEFVHTLAGQAVIAIDNSQLFENLQHANQELSLAYDTTLEGWGRALELRDKETQGHTLRVTNLTLELAQQMGIPEAELLQIRRGALLHDIGKVGIADNILHKIGDLTDEEMDEMQKHPQYGYDLLQPIEYLRPALDIVYCHHEWWDGSGYPRGLKGRDIPLSARIFAVIDVWDELSSDHSHRKGWGREKTLEYIRNLSGRQFDPQVVETFIRMIEEMRSKK